MECTFPWPRTHFPSVLQLMLCLMAEFKHPLLQEVLQDLYNLVHAREEGQNRAARTSYSWRLEGNVRVMEGTGLRKAPLSSLSKFCGVWMPISKRPFP